MSDFSQKQTRALKQRLNRAHVQSREVDGKSIDYIEGWFAISEANAIFGFSGWDREMTHFERVFERAQGDGTTCGYLARVRVRVRAGEAVTAREGTGWGSAKAGAKVRPTSGPSRPPKQTPPNGHLLPSATALGFPFMTRNNKASQGQSLFRVPTLPSRMRRARQ